ncbi:hypothetical protein FIBSPDRAFT_738855, partial [Athelia psychrophila]
ILRVMGATGSGKSTFINLISGSKLPVRGGMGFGSCTSDVDATAPFDFQGRRVVLFDTPGFDNTTKSDTDILKLVAAFANTYYEQGAMLSGVIYMHRINDDHAGGIAEHNFNIFRKLCGDKSLKNIAIVTNSWTEVDPAKGVAREAELHSNDKFFKPILDKQAKLYRHDGTLATASMIVAEILDNHPMALDIQVELVDEHKSILETAAGTMLNHELVEHGRKHTEELEGIKEDMDVAVNESDEEWQKELQTSEKELKAKIERVQTDHRKLKANHDEDKAHMAQRLDAANSGGTRKKENRRSRKQAKEQQRTDLQWRDEEERKQEKEAQEKRQAEVRQVGNQQMQAREQRPGMPQPKQCGCVCC